MICYPIPLRICSVESLHQHITYTDNSHPSQLFTLEVADQKWYTYIYVCVYMLPWVQLVRTVERSEVKYAIY
jgi:hypothetical protein